MKIDDIGKEAVMQGEYKGANPQEWREGAYPPGPSGQIPNPNMETQHPSHQGAQVYPVQINFTTRFFGHNRYIGGCTVAFHPEGYHVMGKRFINAWLRVLIAILTLPLGLIPGGLILYYGCRTYDEDFVPYANIIKVKRKRFRTDILARNMEGKKVWYCMKYHPYNAPFMDWVADSYLSSYII